MGTKHLLCISSLTLGDTCTYTLQVADKRLSAKLNVIGKYRMRLKSFQLLVTQRDKVKGKEVKRDEKFDVSLSEDGLTYTLKIKDMKGVLVVKQGAVHRLIFSDVTDAHEGKYTFRAKGAESEAVPTIAGQTASIKILFKGKPPPKVTWYKEGAEVMEDERTEVERTADGTMLVLSRYVREDSGAIMLRLKSDCSTAVANLHLNVIGSTDHPKPPQGKVEFLELSRKCNKMRWKPLRYNGGKQVTSFVIERSVAGKKSWTLLIKKVEECRAYQYCIRAVKVEGMSDPLETEEVHAGEPLDKDDKALYDISDGSQVKEASVWALSLSGLLLLQSEWGLRPGDCQGPAARSKSRHQPTSPSSSSLLGYDTIRLKEFELKA
ncbi:hypothetical protein NQZ68_026533 [Dissostichus eleginoides]|nr:hypothetical protein NQZ68_026533 [Dissostichus eleginoides]